MINNGSILTKVLAASARRCLLVIVLTFSVLASAQGVLSSAQTGTIEGLHQGDGYLTISGSNYDFHNDVSLIFYDGEQVESNYLNEGLVVRFVLNRDGVISRIEVLGPTNLIQALEES